jgi:hypothetical protein
MGVRGLATFVAKHSNYVLEKQVEIQSWTQKKGFGILHSFFNEVTLHFTHYSPTQHYIYISTLAEVGFVIDGYSLMFRLAEKLDWDFYNGGQYAKYLYLKININDSS